ncbi:MAG: putative integral membrane protein [Rhodobacteraceae bacterium HLUCCA08]|nr:MAG: putative integral membrane protein [Rhodobacteraceae bacterium HLUCCA08]
MSDASLVPEASPRPDVARLAFADLNACLRAGWADFRRAPQFGLFFSGVYVLGGFLMVLLSAGHVTWVLATSLGFPLAAPFAAVGLYEVSRRLEQGQALDWYRVLGVVWDERKRQIPWMGAIIVIYFLFWTFLAHMIFALMMGVSQMRSVTLEAFLTPEGLALVAVELVVGAVAAFILFALTVVSLPLLLDKEVDFITAMLLSVEVVKTNPAVMLAWAAIIAVLSLVALAPAFLGLIVVLPVLGHATWHLYRKALVHRS